MARVQRSARQAQRSGKQQDTDVGLVSRAGPLDVDWPRSAGYFGGVALAVAAGLIDPPLGLFIAAVPFVKMLNRDAMPLRLRVLGQFFEGAAKPVGGDSEGTVWIAQPAPVRRALKTGTRGAG